jgi:hypothetical protein
MKRCKEHHLSLINNNTSSKFAQQLHEDGYTFGPMESIMENLSFYKKKVSIQIL